MRELGMTLIREELAAKVKAKRASEASQSRLDKWVE